MVVTRGGDPPPPPPPEDCTRIYFKKEPVLQPAHRRPTGELVCYGCATCCVTDATELHSSSNDGPPKRFVCGCTGVAGIGCLFSQRHDEAVASSVVDHVRSVLARGLAARVEAATRNVVQSIRQAADFAALREVIILPPSLRAATRALNSCGAATVNNTTSTHQGAAAASPQQSHPHQGENFTSSSSHLHQQHHPASGTPIKYPSSHNRILHQHFGDSAKFKDLLIHYLPLVYSHATADSTTSSALLPLPKVGVPFILSEVKNNNSSQQQQQLHGHGSSHQKGGLQQQHQHPPPSLPSHCRYCHGWLQKHTTALRGDLDHDVVRLVETWGCCGQHFPVARDLHPAILLHQVGQEPTNQQHHQPPPPSTGFYPPVVVLPREMLELTVAGAALCIAVNIEVRLVIGFSALNAASRSSNGSGNPYSTSTSSSSFGNHNNNSTSTTSNPFFSVWLERACFSPTVPSPTGVSGKNSTNPRHWLPIMGPPSLENIDCVIACSLEGFMEDVSAVYLNGLPTAALNMEEIGNEVASRNSAIINGKYKQMCEFWHEIEELQKKRMKKKKEEEATEAGVSSSTGHHHHHQRQHGVEQRDEAAEEVTESEEKEILMHEILRRRVEWATATLRSLQQQAAQTALSKLHSEFLLLSLPQPTIKRWYPQQPVAVSVWLATFVAENTSLDNTTVDNDSLVPLRKFLGEVAAIEHFASPSSRLKDSSHHQQHQQQQQHQHQQGLMMGSAGGSHSGLHGATKALHLLRRCLDYWPLGPGLQPLLGLIASIEQDQPTAILPHLSSNGILNIPSFLRTRFGHLSFEAKQIATSSNARSLCGAIVAVSEFLSDYFTVFDLSQTTASERKEMLNAAVSFVREVWGHFPLGLGVSAHYHQPSPNQVAIPNVVIDALVHCSQQLITGLPILSSFVEDAAATGEEPPPHQEAAAAAANPSSSLGGGGEDGKLIDSFSDAFVDVATILGEVISIVATPERIVLYESTLIEGVHSMSEFEEQREILHCVLVTAIEPLHRAAAPQLAKAIDALAANN